MEQKKNPNVDLRRYYGMFLNIGLVLSMCIVITAFEWKTLEKEVNVDFNKDGIFEQFTEVPPTIFERPKPKLVMPEIKPIEDDEEPDPDVDIIFDAEIAVDIPKPVDLEPLPDETAEETFIYAEEMPEPVGGMQEFYKYISKNIKYPSQARRMGIEGNVTVSFVVDKDGSITEIKVLKGIGAGCDEEAIRILETARKWRPGKQRAVPVRVRMAIPIFFKLG
jgi:periplasmic protein TonB